VILSEKNKAVSDFVQAVREDAKRQAEVAARKTTNEDAGKKVERAAAADAATKDGDLVKHAEKVPGSNQWNW
jgi:hypothetical protein